MKKQLLNLSACAVFIALASIALAVPLTQPVSTLEIPFANTGVITIDGVAEAAYSAEQSTVAFNVTGSTGDDADFTFTFQVAFNPQYLFLFAKVLDDFDNSIPYTTSDTPHEYDNVEVFINLDTVGLVTTYDTNTIQLRVCRGLTDSIQSPGRAAQVEYQLYFENTADGWLAEVAIPWTCVLGSGQVREDMMDYLDAIHGFDMSGADSDIIGLGGRDCQTAWDSDDPEMPDATEDLAWNNRTMFGIVTLAAVADDFVWGPSSIEPTVESNISVYPNPAVNSINFDIEGLQTVEIYSITGVQVMVVESTGQVDISDLNSGLYVARIGNHSVRFVKE